MGKDKGHDGGPVGSRQGRSHARDGWQEGGRQDEETGKGDSFSQTEADARAQRYADRHRDK